MLPQVPCSMFHVPFSSITNGLSNNSYSHQTRLLFFSEISQYSRIHSSWFRFSCWRVTGIPSCLVWLPNETLAWTLNLRWRTFLICFWCSAMSSQVSQILNTVKRQYFMCWKFLRYSCPQRKTGKLQARKKWDMSYVYQSVWRFTRKLQACKLPGWRFRENFTPRIIGILQYHIISLIFS